MHYSQQIILKRWLPILLLSMLFLFIDGAAAQDNPQVEEKAHRESAIDLTSEHKLIIFPQGDIYYPPYLADPHRVGFALQWLHMSHAGITESGSSRYNLKAGGRLGLMRLLQPDQTDRGWQLSLEVGYDAQFDADHAYDNIGWDGNYGLVLTGAQNRHMALKFGLLHTSSHIGDEYAETTGRKRINYTRQELLAGISLAIDAKWRTYAEGGWGFDLRNEELQEPGRVQIGLEFESAPSLWKGHIGWYTALDLSATEEKDWRVDTSFHLGLLMDQGVHKWRFGIEYYKGRPNMGEFFQDDESYISLGLWLDM
ncbi:MAG: DUF1207 domain-containing protein [Deltaproteobacteria bacterium]|nr:DUF1207 domain-containing protein [Deltaproteobacteria bacterium]